jgi:hypothetical protein
MRSENLRSARSARLVAASVVLVVASFGLAACTSARNVLGSHESPCFRVLAVARAAVNDTGRFAGVRYLSPRDLTVALRAMKVGPHAKFAVPTVLTSERSAVCVVEYRGNYSTGGVALGWPPNRHGDPLAIVVVRVRDVRVLVTFVLRKAPLRFSRFLPSLG